VQRLRAGASMEMLAICRPFVVSNLGLLAGKRTEGPG
jgi:hypothetical protein